MPTVLAIAALLATTHDGAAGDDGVRARVLSASARADYGTLREILASVSLEERRVVVAAAWENTILAADADAARALLEIDAAVDPKLLETAMSRGRLEIADLLRAHGVKGVWLKTGYSRGLERAVRWGWAEEVEAALTSGWKHWHEVVPETTLSAAVRRHGLRVESLVREDEAKIAERLAREMEQEVPVVVLPGYEFLAPPYRPDWAGREVAVEVVVDKRGRTRMPRTVNIVERALADYVERLVDGIRVPRWIEDGRPADKRLVIAVTLLPAVQPRAEAEVQQLPVPVRRLRLDEFVLPVKKEERVVLEFVVDHVGTPEPARVVESGRDQLGAIAAESMRAWLFHPGFRDGEAVRVRMRLPFAIAPKTKDKNSE
ncbi:energy transducer TonB [Congregicoccus parvus]|uniref:energy transducer TonB n=1 Tax=Congregicoccus parvus TaxID=3081749 RepID=UPI003FA5F18A